MLRSSFVNDLNARIKDAERIISEQNENLTALRYLLGKELSGESEPQPEKKPAVTPVKSPTVTAHAPQTHAGIDFKGRTSDIILALVRQTNGVGTRPRDIAATLVERKLIAKGSNAVHSHLSELRKRGLVKQNADGLYVSSSKSAAAPAHVATAAAVAPTAPSVAPQVKTGKKRRLSAAGREAIRKAQKARWAASRKATS